MSVSSLPEWKQLLLERKRREEEERDRREKEEEQKFASMPAWKRGIIQRRKAKQESLGDRERERDPKLVSQVSAETIVPVHENPFIRTQSVWRKGRDGEVGNEPEVKDKERDKLSPRAQDGEPVRGRDIELKIERFRDLSEGREKERSRDRSQGREDSWRIGKPLSRIESLREKIRQRELEKLRQRDPEDGDGSKAAADIDNAQTDVDRCEERGNEKEKEWEAACGQVETEEDAASQTSAATFDVTQEAGVLKTCPQLPVSVAHTQAARGEEPTSNTAASEVTSDSFDGSEDEDDPLKHVEEQLRRHRGRHRNIKDDAKAQEKDVETPELNSRVSPQRVCSPTSHLKQTTTTTQSFLRSQSPDNSLKPTDCAPTPAPSPSSPSPTPSPSISPSPTPSPVPFSIKSASGGPVKRGATVTITPKKPAATQTTPAATESGKKKYPTAEEIEVIGGYQNLEKSCLVKKGGTPKRVIKLLVISSRCVSESVTDCFLVPSHQIFLFLSSQPSPPLRQISLCVFLGALAVRSKSWQIVFDHSDLPLYGH
uniref:Phostensin/Taperin PP1-binding domain-containing protein n=1 Tax=Salarias fasciatus TaxID=181472 RepID=A0A672IM03_SALFA